MVLDSLNTEVANTIDHTLLDTATKQSKGYDFLADATGNLVSFGNTDDANSSNPLIWLRYTAQAAMTSVIGVVSPITSTSDRPVSGAYDATGSGMDGLTSLRGMVSSLITLNRTAIYSLQRIQNYRMSSTLSAIQQGCHELDRLNAALHDIVVGLEGSPSESYIDTLYDPVNNSTTILQNTVDGIVQGNQNSFIDDGWKEAEAILGAATLPQGSEAGNLEKFRAGANIVNLLQIETASLDRNWGNLSRYLADSLSLPENIKATTVDDATLERAIRAALQNGRDSKSILDTIQNGCGDDPYRVFNALMQVLSKADASLYGLHAADLPKTVQQFSLEDISVDSDCELVRYDAYLDDIELLLAQVGTVEDSILNQTVLTDAAVVFLMTGTQIASNNYNQAKDDLDGSKTCEDFTAGATGVFDSYDGWADSSIGGLDSIGDVLNGAEEMLDIILSGRILTATSLVEFLKLTPAGRILLVIMECIGNDDLLDLSLDFKDVTGGVWAITDAIEGYVDDINEAMKGLFDFLNGIDASIAAFIAALTALLRFCDSGEALSSPNKYGSTPGNDLSRAFNTSQFDQVMGNRGFPEAVEGPAPDPDAGCLY
jgi:hypothetical protein